MYVMLKSKAIIVAMVTQRLLNKKLFRIHLQLSRSDDKIPFPCYFSQLAQYVGMRLTFIHLELLCYPHLTEKLQKSYFGNRFWPMCDKTQFKCI